MLQFGEKPVEECEHTKKKDIGATEEGTWWHCLDCETSGIKLNAKWEKILADHKKKKKG